MTDALDMLASDAPPASPEDWMRPLEARALRLLGDLAEVGLEVARAVERRAKEAGPDEDLPRIAMAYSRTARAVRLTVMLQSKLIRDLRAEGQAEAKARQAAEADAAERQAVLDPAYRTKARVEAIVERVAMARHPGDKPVVDRLLRESAERLDDEDLYGDLLERPLSELVARLCRDLGLDPDWAELAQEFWAVQEAAGGDVGWPLAAWAATRPPPLAGGEDAMAKDLALATNAQRAGGGMPPPQRSNSTVSFSSA